MKVFAEAWLCLIMVVRIVRGQGAVYDKSEVFEFANRCLRQ